MVMINVSGEVIIILLCSFQRFIKNLKKPTHVDHTKILHTEIPQQTAPEQKKQNTELLQLETKKKQIESTIQELNNPSTFAKYSKMKRELIKLEAKIGELKQKGAESVQTKDQTTPLVEQKNDSVKTRQIKKQEEKLIPAWFGVVFNVVIICLSYTLETSVLPNFGIFPVSFIANANGRANCILVYFACKMIMS